MVQSNKKSKHMSNPENDRGHCEATQHSLGRQPGPAKGSGSVNTNSPGSPQPCTGRSSN